ncbi:hypothetical protein TNCV_1488731 [Trichonephila clavipes]|nr:hypothetical protein TNCV_1488731 [Trichonephila clavipes]
MSKEALVVLNRKHGAVKAQLTRNKDFLNNPVGKDKTHLESKLDTLKSLRITLSDIRNEYYEVVADDRSSSPAVETKEKREIVLNRRPELYRESHRCVQPKINLLKDVLMSVKHSVFPWNLPDVEEMLT